MKKSLILTPDLVWKFQKAASSHEKKLYFLAALNTTGLVDFRVAAEPAPYIMEHCFLDVVTLSSWIDYAKVSIHDKISFPRYVVNLDNRELKNISVWLSAIYEIRQIFLDKSRDQEIARDLNEAAHKIEIEFRKAGLIGRAFTKPLAKWALELTEVTEGVFEPWLEILQTSPRRCLDARS